MPVATSLIIAGIGLAASAAGAAVSYIGSQQVASAQQKQEQLRQQQMNLDVQRQRREILRKALIARSIASNNAAGGGAQQGDSSVIGGENTATGHMAVGAGDLGQNQEIGTNMFAANAAEAAGRGTEGLGSAFGSWGSGLVNNSGTISSVGQGFGLWGPTVGASKTGFA